MASHTYSSARLFLRHPGRRGARVAGSELGLFSPRRSLSTSATDQLTARGAFTFRNHKKGCLHRADFHQNSNLASPAQEKSKGGHDEVQSGANDIKISLNAGNRKAGQREIATFLSRSLHEADQRESEACSVNGHVVVKVSSYKDNGLAVTVEINNLGKLNALSSQLILDLTATFEAVAQVSSIRAVILRGRHNDSGSQSFCAGANVEEMAKISTPAEAESFIRKISGLCTAIRQFPAPVIAQIDGHCYGAGLEVAASCDFRYATDRSKFSMPEVKVGIPSVVEARMLANIIGWAKTRQLTLLGNTITGSQAFQWGLVDDLARGSDSTNELDDIVSGVVEGIVTATGPQAVRVQKALINQWENLTVDKGIEAGVKAFTSMWDGGGKEPKKFMGEVLKAIAERKAKKSQTEGKEKSESTTAAL